VDAVAKALAQIAADPARREDFVRALVAVEPRLAERDLDVREEITGPLVDALFGEDEVLTKRLSSGVVFEFLYRSKIARDFVMSTPEVPDHAWEPMTSKLLVDLARGARQVVVGGAYFGDHAILIARAVQASGGTVHAFEPNDDQRRMLVRNAGLNGLSNIQARPEGLFSDSSHRLKLVGYDSFATAEAAGAGEGFATVSIADYLASAGVSDLDLIVLDIEGGELAALRGAEPFLKRTAGEAPAIVFEVHRSYVDWTNGLLETDIGRYLTGLGYSLFALRDFNSNVDMSGRAIELIPADSVYLEGPPHGFNMVAVKDPARFDRPGYVMMSGVSPKLLRHRDPALHHPLGGL
jgi:FkbM family methyltransferase